MTNKEQAAMNNGKVDEAKPEEQPRPDDKPKTGKKKEKVAPWDDPWIDLGGEG